LLVLFAVCTAEVPAESTHPTASLESTKTATSTVPATNAIAWKEFLAEVARANLDYAAQRYNVSLAQAAVAAAKEFPNPSLELSALRDTTFSGSERMPGALGVGVTQPFELGGKRRARQLIARQSHAAAAATLESFLQNLKLDAATAFAEALARAQTAAIRRQTTDYLADLVRAQRERVRVGDASEVDLLQTRVEEQQLQNERLAAESEAEVASLALSAFLGREHSQLRLIPQGSLELPARDFHLSQLLTGARERRPDLVALRHARDAAQSGIKLAKAQRVPDLDVGVGWIHSTKSENTIAPSPEFNSIGVAFSLPLPLWNRNRAGIATAQSATEQIQKQLEAAELKVEVQLRQNHAAYRSALERLAHLRTGILKDAETVLEARRFSYQRGQTTLHELLEAQRATAEVRLAYFEALSDAAKALIELERAAGLADVDFSP
jgi:cobalt-zinc-cadmium efflux system outer membrane protein